MGDKYETKKEKEEKWNKMTVLAILTEHIGSEVSDQKKKDKSLKKQQKIKTFPLTKHTHTHKIHTGAVGLVQGVGGTLCVPQCSAAVVISGTNGGSTWRKGTARRVTGAETN